MNRGPEIITAAGSGVRLRFTPLPLKGFGGERGLFVPVHLYTKNGMALWQYEAMIEPQGCADTVKYVGAGIMREEKRSGQKSSVSFLSLLAFDKIPECKLQGEDLVVAGSENGSLEKVGALPLLSDMPGIREYIARRYQMGFPISISKLIPEPDRALRERMYDQARPVEVHGR